MRQAVGDALVYGIQIHRRFRPIAKSIQLDNTQMSQEQLAYPGSMMSPQIHNRTVPKYMQHLYPMPQVACSGLRSPQNPATTAVVVRSRFLPRGTTEQRLAVFV